MSVLGEELDLVVGILRTDHGQEAGGAVRNIEAIKSGAGLRSGVSSQGLGQTVLDYAQALQKRHAGSHILLLHENVFVPSSFFESVRSQIRFFADRKVAWGVIGNSGVAFPYFKSVCNMLVADAPPERFAGTLPAVQLDPYVLLIHHDVELATFARASGCPEDAPVGDVAVLAAWEAEKPCWICNLPVHVVGSYADAQPTGDRDAWGRYLATSYNNASFVSAFGTVGLPDHKDDTKDFYYKQVEPVLNRATRHLDPASVSVCLFATYYDVDIFDRCLMSVVSQFQRPGMVYIVGLNRLDGAKRAAFRDVVERYRHYLSIHWAEDELSGASAIEQLETYVGRVPDDGYSLLIYDTFVLFPQAVQQVGEFLRFTLRDGHVLPITIAEVSRLRRIVETRFSSCPRPFFREIEKQGFGYRERWLSAEPDSTLHFTFPNRFLRETPLAAVDLFDLGSCLPQRLLSEPLSFLLIERSTGYMSFQVPSLDETISPITEAGTPFHLANKAGSLMAARSNVPQHAMISGGIAPAPSRNEAAQREARLHELESYHGHAESELANLRRLTEQQEISLNRLRAHWYLRARRRIFGLARAVAGLLRGSR